MIRGSKVALLALALFVGLVVAEYGYRWFICPCGASCICDPCVCGDMK